MTAFADRVDGGRRLAAQLQHLRSRDVVVLGIPRGGVPVAAEVARSLGAPLDVVVVRKLGLPWQPELALGAIGEGGYRVLDRDLVARTGVSAEQLREVERRERLVLDSRVALLRKGRPPADLTGRVAVVVDDGIATGATARVACEVARHLGAERVVLAVPVAPADSLAAVREADEVVCVATPYPFAAVGNHYGSFHATTDDEVVALLEEARSTSGPRPTTVVDTDTDTDTDTDVAVAYGSVVLEGSLHLPADPIGMVVFAHGSGSSRHSPRNQYVASVLNAAGLGTLLLDLLTRHEEQDRSHVFDIALLARRLVAAVSWVGERPGSAGLPVGLFGASTGAAAALWAASEPGLSIGAVVSRGGRPDLAGARLERVTAPTLLIVGGADPVVLQLNREARARLRCPNRLVVVEGATHLFEEPGTLDRAAALARDWFVDRLGACPRPQVDETAERR
jgi:putative phosphoribosyl transferase